MRTNKRIRERIEFEIFQSDYIVDDAWRRGKLLDRKGEGDDGC